MKRIKSIVNAPFYLLRGRSPEILLVLFVACMLPLLFAAAGRLYSLGRLLFADTGSFMRILSDNMLITVWTMVCLLGFALLIALIIKGWNNIWAVARKMILEALHRKVVLILLLFFVIMMPSLPFILETEGSIKSQVQIVLTYSLALAEILLVVLAIFVCTASVCSEIDKKQVHITDTKPLMRWQFLFGKLFGITLLCGVLLFLMSGAVFGLVRYMARDRAFEHLPAWEAAEKREDLMRVREEVLVARNAVSPRAPDVSEYVERRISERKQRGELTTAQEETRARVDIEQEAIRRRTTAPANRGIVQFEFPGFDPESESPIYLRAKPNKTNPDADHLCPGLWHFLHPATGEEEEDWLMIGHVQQQLVPEAYQEIAISPRVIAPTGSVYLAYENLCTSTGVQFDLDDGIELMQKVGGFPLNFYRSLLVVLAHVVLLAALAIMLGAMFSWPVASFCVGAIMVVGLLGPWVAEHALSTPALYESTPAQVFIYVIRQVTYYLLNALFLVMPQFGRFSPIERVANGRLVGLGYTASAAAVLVFLQSGAAMLLAAYAYWRRELAKIIV